MLHLGRTPCGEFEHSVFNTGDASGNVPQPTAASRAGHLQYVGQRKKCPAYCSVMSVIVILGCHVCTLWIPPSICSSEGHRDMATEAAEPLTPSR